jgi:hypothetical protein
MSNMSIAKKLEPDTKPVAKAQHVCGPPWAPQKVLHVVPLPSNPVDDALTKAKNVNGGKLSEAQADRIALAVPLVEKLTAESPGSNVGNPMWDKVIGPPWAGKDKPQVPTDFASQPGLTEPFIAKQG